MVGYYTIWKTAMTEIFDQITNFIMRLFSNSYLSVIFLSFVPMIESTGAVPIALNMGMHPLESIFFSSVGAIVICPLIYWLLEPIIVWMKSTKILKKIAESIEINVKAQAQTLEKKATYKNNNTVRKLWLLFLFILLPMPFSGLWTGSAVAIFLSLPQKSAIATLIVANFAASSIICCASLALGKYSYIILIALVLAVAISFITIAIRLIVNHNKKA